MTRIIVYYEYTEGTDNRHGDINKTINNYNESLIFALLLKKMEMRRRVVGKGFYR